VDITKRFYGHKSGERLDKTIYLLDLNKETKQWARFDLKSGLKCGILLSKMMM
jgi:hypothetical protein